MQKFFLSITLVMFSLISLAQTGSTLQGKVVDAKTLRPMESVVVTVQNTALMQVTGKDGQFFFPDVPPGKQYVFIKSEGYVDQLLEVEISPSEGFDLGQIILDYDLKDELQLALVVLTENDLADDQGGGDNTAGLLQASRDVFQQTAAFNWGQAWFRIRGLDNELAVTMINGVVMNKVQTGRPQWNNWGGLNDVTRLQEFTMGSAPSDYNFGTILGTQEINTRASLFRGGNRVTFSGTNTNYNWRAMATHASGMNERGWAYVFSGSRRWAQEANFPGTDYSANSFFIAVEKRINEQHSINVTSVMAENSRGRNSFNTEEVNDIMGTDYNSFWGFQNGKKRNSRMRSINEPFTILSHYWKFNSKTQLNTNVSYQFGRFADSRLDFQNVPNPDPTYYRNLPSFYINSYNDFDGVPDFVNAAANLNFFRNNSQINWDAMYAANQNTVTPGRSVYVLVEDRNDDKDFTANTILSAQLADHIMMNGAVSYRKLKSHNYRAMADLLGGQFYNDIDPFLSGDAREADLNNPGRQIREGDIMRYNFNLHADIVDAFTQFKFRYDKIDFYLAQTFSKTQYQREGLFRNGLYADNSFGRSKNVVFDNYGFKGGFTYKITGRHLIDFNAVHMTRAPDLRSVFSNARLNNIVTPNISSEEINSMDLSYIIRAPKFKSRITGFYNEINNSNQIAFFFVESGLGSAFVSEIMTGIKRRNMGVELGIDYQLTQTVRLTGAMNFAQYLYANNPNVLLNVDEGLDNDDASLGLVTGLNDFGKTNLKNYRAFSSPERAYSIGIEYRNPQFWWIGADMNLLTHRFLNVSGVLRTDSFVRDPSTGISYPGATEQAVRDVLRQERLEDMYLLNIRGGKSWRVSSKNRNTIGFFATINNAIGERYRTGGFEQARKASFPDAVQDTAQGVRTFGPRYFYGFGRTYFVNFYYNF